MQGGGGAIPPSPDAAIPAAPDVSQLPANTMGANVPMPTPGAPPGATQAPWWQQMAKGALKGGMKSAAKPPGPGASPIMVGGSPAPAPVDAGYFAPSNFGGATNRNAFYGG